MISCSHDLMINLVSKFFGQNLLNRLKGSTTVMFIETANILKKKSLGSFAANGPNAASVFSRLKLYSNQALASAGLFNV